ncbi:hypothetical protein ACHAXT_006293 [Thalassiosira profunda]
MAMVPSGLLLRYFDIAQRRLQRSTDDLDEARPSDEDVTISWHRSRIVTAQLASLDESISEWQQREGDGPITAEDVQGVLPEIGAGNFARVSFSDLEEHALPSSTSSTGLRSRSSAAGSGNGNAGGQGTQKDTKLEQQLQLTEAVEKTNEIAREVFARSILLVEWRLEQSQSGRELRGNSESIDEKPILEYCGLMMAAARLPEVLRYLENGTVDFGVPRNGTDAALSVDERLVHIQRLYWTALGWDSDSAMKQLNALLSGKSAESAMFQDADAADTLTKYTSMMTVAATNAAMATAEGETASNAARTDGTTRVVSVAYSEKIVSVPTDTDAAITSQSLSAPTSNTITEHETTQQRQELDVAQKTSILQQQIWQEFQALHSDEQSKVIEEAKAAHFDFLEKVTNTPPGMERVLLMQSLDAETQKLLVLYKLQCGAGPE